MNKLTTLARIGLNYKLARPICDYRPIRLWIEPTNVCNLRCVMCPNSSIPSIKRGFMDLELFKKIVDEVAGFATNVNLHHRGESLMHPDIIEMIAYTKSKGIESRLHTNANLMDRDMSEAILEAGLDMISFSFDGYDKETYESIRIRGNFEKTVSNILTFLELKEKMRKNTYTIFETIEFETPDEEQLAKRREFRRQFEGLPLDKFVVKKPHNWAGRMEIKGMSLEKQKRKFSPCTLIWYSQTIFWDGTVVPCPQDFFGEYPVGDVNNSTLSEIWNGERIVELRKKMNIRDYKTVNPCVDCDRLWKRKLAGIPVQNLKSFFRENILGFNKLLTK